MIEVGIVGASGYTGAELLRILAKHPEAKVSWITSRAYEGKPLAECFPSVAGINLTFKSLETLSEADDVQVVFTALPHGTGMETIAKLLEAGKKVVDLSADFRFADVDVYQAHYGPHACPQYMKEAVYGLTEINREQIKGARLVGNPGCYPTSTLLPLIPLLKAGAVSPSGLIADCKSGVSGAGRTPGHASHFCSANESCKAYKVAAHRHEPEIISQLETASGKEIQLIFTPHLIPMNRGILSTIYAAPEKGFGLDDIFEIWNKAYGGEKFIRVVGKNDPLPDTAFVRGTNNCMFTARRHEAGGRIVIVSAIDNLGKGASSQAVQNMNVMLGLDEDAGLFSEALYP